MDRNSCLDWDGTQSYFSGSTNKAFRKNEESYSLIGTRYHRIHEIFHNTEFLGSKISQREIFICDKVFFSWILIYNLRLDSQCQK